ncbi:MAG TPA: O-antigen ligase family protein [Candidatus Dormibacteraeota bacterium]|nr:O-antigen ligase family protein [Candidatus Dormibacteraeota bacterium]
MASSLLSRAGARLGLDSGDFRISLLLCGLTCALMPAYTLRWHVGFYPTTVLEDAVALTLVAFAVESYGARAVPSLRSPFSIAAAILLLAGAVSLAVAPDKRAALGIYRAYFVEPVVFFYVIGNVVRTPKRASVLLAGLGVAGIVVSVANAFVVLDAIRHHVLNVVNTGPVAIFMNANDVPLFLVPLIAIAGSYLLYSRDRLERILSVGFIALAVVATLLSFSRGGYLALAVVALGLAISHRRRWWLLGGAVAAAIVLILIPPINHRLAIELDFSNGSNTLVGRFELWKASLQMLSQHLIFGAGLSGFAATLAPYWNPTHTDRFIYPHNIVLNFWSETGLLGVVAFAWIMVVGFRTSWLGSRQTSSPWRPLELGILLALVGVIVHGLVDVPYFKNDLSLEFWTLIGLAWAGVRWTAPLSAAGVVKGSTG